MVTATNGNMTVVGSDARAEMRTPDSGARSDKSTLDGKAFLYETWVPPPTPQTPTTQPMTPQSTATPLKSDKDGSTKMVIINIISINPTAQSGKTTPVKSGDGSSTMVIIISICSAFILLTFIIVVVCYRLQKHQNTAGYHKLRDYQQLKVLLNINNDLRVLSNINNDLQEGSEPQFLSAEDTSLTKEECLQKIGEYFKKCHFEAMTHGRERIEFRTFAKHDDSAVLFPTTIRRFLAGSRAEQLFIESSDYDFIVEIGPGMVTPDFKEGKENGRFYCTPAENIGFHYVFDSNKQRLSPATLQAKMFSQVMNPKKTASSVIVELEKRDESQAALPTKDINDYVLALRLSRWPKYIFECIKDHFPDDLFYLLKEKPLYLVCKSHPSSSDVNKDYEWRLSFSVLEMEIAKQINHNLRKSYLMCKHLLAKTKLLRFPKKSHVKSYELKTVFMRLSRELNTLDGQEYDQVGLTLTIFQRLLHHYEVEQNIPNYFLPEQNILDTSKEEKMIEGTKFLRNYFYDEYHIAQLIDILDQNG